VSSPAERSRSAGRLKVLHLGHTAAAGGAEFALIRMLQAGVHWRPAVLLPPTDGRGVFARLPVDVPLRVAGVRQPAGVSAGGIGLIADATARLIAQTVVTRFHPGFRRADLIDANTTRAAAYGALAAWTSRVPFIVHLRDMAHPEALGRGGFEVLRRVVLSRADGVIADTHATLDSARPYLRSDAATAVIPSASGLTLRLEGPGLPTGPVIVGMLARIDPWKGQADLLEAFAIALAETDARLQFAGDVFFGHEEYLAKLRRRADELGLSDRVDFLGHVDDVGSLLDTWHIAVQASTRPEPLGQNVLQYLAAGRAVIVADEGGPTEWVRNEENGLRAAPRDLSSLAEALRRLALDVPLRDRLAAQAARTPGLLDDASVAASHSAFYAEVMARAGQGRPARSRRMRHG
jgi:glycosyltransferase involved in cell wall biosynthesis